ncbi:dTDP-4-dehydrorhamnose 3,5-epimerase [Telluria sp. B2]
MKVHPTAIPGVLLIEPLVHEDERGVFFETFNERAFESATGLRLHFVQDNQSFSVANTVRGLHYQVGKQQGKLVRVIRGTIFDVAVDMRRASPTFGQATTLVLSAGNRRQLWIPPGCAHGFLALGDGAECIYKITDYWSPAHERVLLWNDPALAIAWPLDGAPILSEKDRAGTPLRDAEVCDFS